MKCQLCDYEQELQPGNSDGLILNAFEKMASFEVTEKLGINTTPAKNRMIKAHNAAASRKSKSNRKDQKEGKAEEIVPR